MMMAEAKLVEMKMSNIRQIQMIFQRPRKLGDRVDMRDKGTKEFKDNSRYQLQTQGRLREKYGRKSSILEMLNLLR